jgi:AraC-like DNA-binding protein
VPIEDDANAKAEFYLQAYQHSVSGHPACLGSYVFYWAHKQEKTHTWYGMFLPDGSRTPAIDAMSFLWTDRWPTNRCPALQGNKLTVVSADNKAPVRPGIFLPGTKLARAIEVSEVYLRGLFRSLTGVPPLEFLQRRRIERACDILRSSDESIKSIAWSVGFTDVPYFYRVFKKWMRTTPASYRARPIR